jgi:hypothetical protein
VPRWAVQGKIKELISQFKNVSYSVITTERIEDKGLIDNSLIEKLEYRDRNYLKISSDLFYDEC